MDGDSATIHDVARLAGVSTSTVSRALSGARRVSPDLVERVTAAARQLGYRPDSVGQSLRTRHTQTIGLIVCDITNPFFPALVQEVEKASRAAGFSLLLADSQNDPDIERECIELFLNKRIDALLCSPSHRFLSRHALETARAAVPVIQIDRVVDESIGYVRVDQRAAIGLILDHLAAQGRCAPAFIGSDPESVTTSWERQIAYIDLSAAIDPAAPGRVLVGDFTVEWGRKAARQMLSTWPGVDAIVCGNDLIALGVIEEFAASGVPCPGRIAVASFDDSLIASATWPSLTSVRQPIARMGALGVKHAVAAMTDPATLPADVLEPELVVRKSTGPAD